MATVSFGVTKSVEVGTAQTIEAAIAAALAAAGGAHNSTAEINTIQAAVQAADVVVIVNTANITSVSALKAALNDAAGLYASRSTAP